MVVYDSGVSGAGEGRCSTVLVRLKDTPRFLAYDSGYEGCKGCEGIDRGSCRVSPFDSGEIRRETRFFATRMSLSSSL